jgi:hypothetical protein
MSGLEEFHRWTQEAKEKGDIPDPTLPPDPNDALQEASRKPKPEFKKNPGIPEEKDEVDHTFDNLPNREAKEWWHN